MGPNFIRGQLGNAQLLLNTDDGVLTVDGREIVLMRVKLIARLFSDIMQKPMFSGLLKDAGRMMGEDYTVDWLLTKTPAMAGPPTAGNLALPPDVVSKGAEYEILEDQIDRGALDAPTLEAEKQASREIRQLLQGWLAALPDATLEAAWQSMLDLEIYGGWGKAQLVEFRRSDHDPHVRIDVTASFTARPAHIWYQHGIAGKPVCSLLAGYIEGEARFLLAQEDLICSETQCRLQGGDKCSFVVKAERFHIK